MKKIFFLLSATLIVAVSCNKNKSLQQIDALSDSPPLTFSNYESAKAYADQYLTYLVLGILPLSRTPEFVSLLHEEIQKQPYGEYTVLISTSHLCIKVYDLLGKEIATLLNDDAEQGNPVSPMGTYSLLLNTDHFPKGAYLVKMISNFGIENQKLMVQ